MAVNLLRLIRNYLLCETEDLLIFLGQTTAGELRWHADEPLNQLTALMWAKELYKTPGVFNFSTNLFGCQGRYMHSDWCRQTDTHTHTQHHKLLFLAQAEKDFWHDSDIVHEAQLVERLSMNPRVRGSVIPGHMSRCPHKTL